MWLLIKDYLKGETKVINKLLVYDFMILHVSLMFLKTDSVFLMTVGGHKHSARLPWAFNGKLNNKKNLKW